MPQTRIQAALGGRHPVAPSAAWLETLGELGLGEELWICGLAKSRLKGLGDARAESGERGGDGVTLLAARAVRQEAHRIDRFAGWACGNEKREFTVLCWLKKFHHFCHDIQRI